MTFRSKDIRQLGYYCDSNCCPKFATFVWNEWSCCPVSERRLTLFSYVRNKNV